MYSRAANAKPCLVLACGHMCSPAQWQHQQAGLADLADIVLADLTLDDSVTNMAKRILDRAPPRFSFAGFSLGGFVAFALLRMAPERIERLALIDTSARQDSADRASRREKEIQRAEAGEFESLLDPWIPTLVSDAHPRRQVLLNEIEAGAKAVGRQAYLRQQKAMLSRPDSRENLKTVRCPVTVICGREDRLTTLEHHEEIAAAIPRARLTIVEGSGHMSTIEQPEAVTAALREWISQDVAAGATSEIPTAVHW